MVVNQIHFHIFLLLHSWQTSSNNDIPNETFDDTVLADYNFTLITNPYVNEVTLRRQKPPLKCC